MDNWTFFIVLLVVAVLAVVFLRKRRPAELAEAKAPSAPAPPRPGNAPATYQPLSALASSQAASQAPSPPAAPANDPDQQVLEQLRAAGSDLSKSHEIEFFLYFPSEEAAEQAGLKLETEGFAGEVRDTPDRAAWLCLVYRQMVPERTKLAALRKRFNTLTRELGGEYDGWETKIEK